MKSAFLIPHTESGANGGLRFVYTKQKQLAQINDALKKTIFVLVLSGTAFAHAFPRKFSGTRAAAFPSADPLTNTRFSKHYFDITPIPDDTINACGTSTVLNSGTIPGYSNPTWSDGSSGSTFTATSSGTYWWQVTGANVVSNGDFSSGNIGFTSSYNMPSSCAGCCCGVLTREGAYAVNSNPHNVHSRFTSMGDHTSGSGEMLVVNGAPVTGVTVWNENITVLPNTDYVFSVWATSVNPVSPAILQFSINGGALGTIALSSSVATGIWQYFTTVWNSGSASGSIPIALVNQNTAASGNDFAVDDIVFAPVYRQNVVVNLNPLPVLTLSPSNACNSYDLTNAINGYDPTTYIYKYTDSSGNTVPNPKDITQSGTYTITEQNILTGCQSLPETTTITIVPNPPQPGINSL